MRRKIPIIGAEAGLPDICACLRRKADVPEMLSAVSLYSSHKYLWLTGSGICALYLLLRALKEESGRTEVVLPAYSAGSLAVAVLKAGLKPVFCDISADFVSFDEEKLFALLSKRPLAVVCVHLFGIPATDFPAFKARAPDVFFIEDCAQSMGATVGSRYAGSFLDASVFSFNRGKNIPLCGGGCVTVSSEPLAQKVERLLAAEAKRTGFKDDLSVFFKLAAFYLGTQPAFYGIVNPFLARFKETRPPDNIPVGVLSRLQINLGKRLMAGAEEVYAARCARGLFLNNELRSDRGIILPAVRDTTRPVFNRFPLVIRDTLRRERIERRLGEEGIETSRMYERPLCDMCASDYGTEDFRHARFYADHLLTLPVHSGVPQEALEKMARVIRDCR